jgi:hypothetical protein
VVWPCSKEPILNLSELRDRVRSLTGIRLETLRSDESIDAVLNEAYFEVLNLGNWPFLSGSETIQLNAGQDSFGTPNGYDEISSITYSTTVNDQTRLRQTTLDELDYMEQGEVGDPMFYARIDEKNIRIWPSPSSGITLELRGKISPEPLVRNSDVPVIGAQFQPMLSYRASSKILAEESDESNRARSYQEEANVMFARMQRFYLTSNDHGLIVMGSNRRRRYINGR